MESKPVENSSKSYFSLLREAFDITFSLYLTAIVQHLPDIMVVSYEVKGKILKYW